MHELAVCEGLMTQVIRVARDHGAARVRRIRLDIGALSGVEPDLLSQAFTIARAGTVADGAVLEITTLPPRLRCTACGAETEAAANRLLCGRCGGWRVRLISGDEMLLRNIDLDIDGDIDRDIDRDGAGRDEEGDTPCVPHAAAQ